MLRRPRRTRCKPGFLRWSRTATGFADLPADAARTCIELLLRSGITPASLSALEPDAYRGTAFEKRLLDAWYTGLFKLDGLSDVRSFDTTLMWRVAGVDPLARPVPGRS